jgi:copper chaperone CopZ
MTTTALFVVPGMTCGHCVAAVTEEIAKLGFVDDVAIDLTTKRVTVTGTDLVDADIRRAIDDAGFDTE